MKTYQLWLYLAFYINQINLQSVVSLVTWVDFFQYEAGFCEGVCSSYSNQPYIFPFHLWDKAYRVRIFKENF